MLPVDSHAHLYDAMYAGQTEDVISSALGRVGFIICPSEDRKTSEQSVQIASGESRIFAAVGIHPLHTEHVSGEDWKQILSLAHHSPKVVALGETGLDFFSKNCDRELQKYWFSKHIQAAGELHLPLIIHDRKAHGEILSLLQKQAHGVVSGVIHGYSGSLETAKALINTGFYISFGGSITYPGSRRIRQVASTLPLDRILIETDSPYQAPFEKHGELNVPENVWYVAQALAKLKQMPVSEVIETTGHNAAQLFGISRS